MSVNTRVWLYYRLSRDEDKELNSLMNQKAILIDYANRNGYSIVGESFDDNISGMHFDRDGVLELQEAAERRIIDAVLVKDLSRLGRHRTMTAIFIENLRGLGVKVISATESIDTSNENDELIIGFKQLLNDQYVRDLSRKISVGFKMKQKTTGIILTPPFGYKKDKNTNTVEIVEECAEIVRLIFSLYTNGMGYKKIGLYLTENGYMTPAYYQKQLYNKSVPYNKTKIGKMYIWNPRTIDSILTNEAYNGILVCGKTSSSKIYKKRENVKKELQFRHDGVYPKIIDDETWALSRQVREGRNINKVQGGNKKIHRYAGLIKCGDCDGTASAKRRKIHGETDYIEYVCTTYHRVGRNYCKPHRIRENILDDLIYGELEKLKYIADENLRHIDRFINEWTRQQDDYNRLIGQLEFQIQEIKDEIKTLIRQSVKEPMRESIINEIISENEMRIESLNKQIDNFRNYDTIGKKAQTNIIRSVEIINRIIDERSISEGHLRMLIEKIIIKETDDGMLDIEFILRAPFNNHLDLSKALVPVEEESKTENKITRVYAPSGP